MNPERAETVMRQALISILMDNLSRNPALGQRAMSHHIVLDSSVDAVVKDGDTIRFNPDYVNQIAQTMAGQKALAAEITALLVPTEGEKR